MSLKNCLLFLVFLLLTGCIRHEDDFISKYCPGSCTQLQGRLTTADGTEPLAGALLTATWKDIHPPLGGGTIRKKGVARTDANGNYTLSFLLRDAELQDGYIAVTISLDQQTYATCDTELVFYAFELARDTTIAVNYNAPRKAYITAALANKADIRPGDHFSTTFTYQSGKKPDLCGPGVVWNWTDRTQQVLDVAAQQPVIVRNQKIKSGVETTETDTLMLSPGQQLAYKAVF